MMSALFIPRFSIKAIIALLIFFAFMTGCDSKTSEVNSDLRVADQFNLMHTVLISAGEQSPSSYTMQWSNFVGGPAIIAAAVGGSIDVGWMASTPLVFAQAAGSPIKVIAAVQAANPQTSSFALVVASNSLVRSVADLKGKNVFHLPGTQSQYFLFKVLEKSGLGLDDIHTVNAMTGSGAATALLENGRIDAAVINDPTRVVGEDSGKLRVIATAGDTVKSGANYLVVPAKVLEDKDKSAQLADFIRRADRSYKWQIDNFDEAVPATAALYKLPENQAATILGRSLMRIVPIDDAVIAQYQAEADVFVQLGMIKKSPDSSSLFDRRFNDHLFKEVHINASR